MHAGRMRMVAMNETKAGLAWHSPQFYRQAHEIAGSRVRFIEHQGRRILFVDFSRADLDMVRAVAAEVLGLLADRTRLALLQRLAQGEADVTTLTRACGAARPAVSQHLGRLRLAGLLGQCPRLLQVWFHPGAVRDARAPRRQGPSCAAQCGRAADAPDCARELPCPWLAS